ncbi:hypothetical protein [Streptomyces albireticuli]|uniref:Uncharacterized protein n=1 Tax=Streptomyces albireticuli TaxID=1940 RepID=A0A2A2DB33_9ACTN|nr:hypothetical protein [Streptomyces albireticuli]MCD9145425.1 hypothetical protein [Streptomyces albireticuli]MCD9165010.1 hypothetical protein [Streptomyces albireticuli]MCD9195399.1 hypothetical protein [Streptomyces albireticuli]PAU48691.1 hypothetical protein CK936_11580 [Streptomyces albireticuli]
MRLRTTLVTLASALALVFSVSGPAYANARGTLAYNYYPEGNGEAAETGGMPNPRLNECLNVPEIAHIHSDEGVFAFAPQNGTDAQAALYAELDCKGASVSLDPNSPRQSDDIHFRSAKFTKN